MVSGQGAERSPIVERETLDRMLDGVVAGRYHLVLGAGASAGVCNAAGDLPMARALTELLLAEVEGAPSPDGITLQRAFQRAVAEQGADAVEGLLRMRFGGCTPHPWQLQSARIPWQAIWTLNVDDSMEFAYEGTPDRAQRAIVKLWQDPPSPLGGMTEEVPIVHLHGYVGDIDEREDRQLVFSLEQYLGALRASDLGNWQTRFRGEYQSGPVIVIGAQLHDEVDLAGVIQAGNISSSFGLPSIIVRPGMSAFEQAEYRDWGLVPVDATAEEFMDLLTGAVAQRAAAVAEGPYANRYTRATFLELSARKASFSRPAGHDFYGGHQPQWLDILENQDAVPNWVESLAAEIGSAQEFPQVQRLYYVSGSPFSGKSTSLLRLAREMVKQGWHPIQLVGNEKLDVGEALAYFAARPNAFLIIDDLRPDSAEVATLLSQADGMGQRMVVIACDRRRSLRHTRRVVSIRYLIGVEDPLFVEPTSGLWTAILRRRSKAGRLGILEGKDRKAWSLHFTQHQMDLFSSLASLEEADGFVDRGLEVIASVDPQLRSAFVAIGLFANVGLEAPAFAVAASSGVTVSRLMEAIQDGGELAEWVTLDPSLSGFLRLRHGYLGELLLHKDARKAHQVDLAKLTTNLLIAISDRVGHAGIRRKDFYYRAASQLMDLQLVQRVVNSDDVDDWYAAIREPYAWNARYWEQRALGLPDQLDRAYSYAQRAVSRHADAFTYNTLGTVLMRRASHPQTAAEARRRYWGEANKALLKSRSDGRGRFDFPFLTYMTHTVRVIEAAGELGDEWEQEMRTVTRSWIADADAAGLRADHDLESRIQALPTSWTSDLPRSVKRRDLEQRPQRPKRPSSRGGAGTERSRRTQAKAAERKSPDPS